MTDNEKAKAYDEALEIAKNEINIKGIGDTVDLCKQLFPELCESEDERIRKAIIKSIEEDSSVYEQEVSKEQMLAYLEKQKVNTDGDFARGYDCGYECCLNSHGAEWFEKQKEQKPFNVCEQCPYYKDCPDYNEKIQEWSEEDEKMLKSITGDLFCGTDFNMELKFAASKKVNWLKDKFNSLRLQPKQDCGKATINGESIPTENHSVDIPLAKWSEDDEKALKRAIDCVRSWEIDYCDGDNRISERLKSLRPSWKPSEEQMKELKLIINGKAVIRTDFIRTLYNDLKKLM